MSMTLRALLVISILSAASPAFAAGKIYYADGQRVQELKVKEALKNLPTEWKGPIQVNALGRTDVVSSHIVWVKTRENPHYHAHHEATVMLLKGKGILNIGDQEIDMKPGDVVTIPQGVVHAFMNQSKDPAAAYVVFAPPFDGKDTIEIGDLAK